MKLVFIFLISLLYITSYAQEVKSWELKHPLSAKNFKELTKKLKSEYPNKNKERSVYFLDTDSFEFYKKQKIIFRVRLTKVGKDLMNARIDIKFRKLSGKEASYLSTIEKFPAGHSMKCENDLVISRSPMVSCSLRYRIMTSISENMNLFKLFTTFQKNVAKSFLKTQRNLTIAIDDLLTFGPIRSTVQEFKIEKNKEIDMERWILNNEKIFEISIKTNATGLTDDMSMFQKLVKKYHSDLETMSTKTKWAFELF